MAITESVKDYLYRRLKEVGANRYEAIAQETGVALSFIRKFVYGSRENPRIETIQPLLNFFAEIDAGKRSLTDLDKALPAEKAALGEGA